MSQGESATPLGKVRGLGSAREGGHHWLEERFTSIALLLLSFWLLFSLFLLPDLSLVIIKEWLGSAWGAIPMALLVITAFKHGLDGLKVAVDDYVHDEGTRIGLHYFLAMAAIAGASVALFALARIVFGAAA
ncbi:MAG TPA: succinate dehydrogenase, hydrophobic membrane anchor protein [Sphingomicrobium sp.]|jgi:succinate dehydrogenase / fumarate reductase membrane anchor subunit|nr:succinate dehydrogenase, hydrophobic membrane anchor protein [Sphingomicrobium sp.]